MGYPPPNGASKYKQASIESASREKILIMLYEAAIRNMKLAKKALDEKRIADKGTYLGKAHSIISELITSLDHNVGGKLAQDLESLYIFMLDQITKGNIENSGECLESVIKLLETLLEGWNQAVETVRKEKVSGLKATKA